jgi:hypothetical protein
MHGESLQLYNKDYQRDEPEAINQQFNLVNNVSKDERAYE